MISDRGEAVEGVAQREQSLAARHVPHFNGAVLRARGKTLPVGAEGDGKDRVDMVLERSELLARLNVPELDQLVVAARGCNFPLGTRGHRINAVLVTFDRSKELMALDVPDLDFTRTGGQPAGCGKPFPIVAERQRTHQVSVAGERRQRFAAGRVHQSHFFVAAHGQELAIGRIGDRAHG